MRTSSELTAVLQKRRTEIILAWAKKLRGLHGSQYQQASLEDIALWLSQVLEALMGILSSDASRAQAPETRLGELAIARPQAEFPIYEITEGLLIAREVILPIIQEYWSDDPGKAFQAIAQLDVSLRQLIGSFERQFSEEIHRQLTAQAQQRLVESESLHRTTTALLQKLTLDEILEIVCYEARRLTGATGSTVLLLEDGEWLQVMISTGKPVPVLERLAVNESLAGRAVQHGEPCLVNDPASQIQAYSRNPDLQALLVIPLRGKDVNIGAIDVVNKPGGFSDEDIRIMSLFADQAAIAIENARLHHQAEKLAVVEERQRLARELHDSVTQALYSLTLYADATRLALSSGKSQVAIENLQELRSMAREAMLDMRLLIFELHPPILEKEGLVAALRTRLEAVEARSGIQTDYQVEAEKRLPVFIESELFRIAQEALNNAVKHSQARHIKVHLSFSEKSFLMQIWDDGVGFDPQSTAGLGGLGLRGMEERAQRINAGLQLWSAPGKGTTLTVEVDI